VKEFLSAEPARHSIAQNRQKFREMTSKKWKMPLPWITSYTANDPELLASISSDHTKAIVLQNEGIIKKVRNIREAVRNRTMPDEYRVRGMRFELAATKLINSREGTVHSQNNLDAIMGKAFDDEWKEEYLHLRRQQVAIGKKLLNEDYIGDFHGVEVMKGGKVSLLNIMLEGAGILRWSGPFGELSNPQWFAAPHGPYYIMLNLSAINRQMGANDALIQQHIYDESTMKAFLVPDKKSLAFFTEHLEYAAQMGILTVEEAINLKRKLITYDEFLRLEKGLICNSEKFSLCLTQLRS
jgi:hypothetical protein